MMSHIDELDDYEAELELRLKREYSAVYSLFRYCVLTQDGTYLCNKLDMQYVPQPAYPFFQIKMEDVWVWDKSRPTRMIPRVEVNTSGDVLTSTRGIIRVGRLLSHTQTSSILIWKNGYAGWGTYCMSSLLHRYVPSCVSTQYRKSE